MMHSDEIKEEIRRIKDELDDLENATDDPSLKLGILTARVQVLNADALNELNWSFYYAKEELKNINRNLQRLQ